jgi:hypothetical protein
MPPAQSVFGRSGQAACGESVSKQEASASNAGEPDLHNENEDEEATPEI